MTRGRQKPGISNPKIFSFQGSEKRDADCEVEFFERLEFPKQGTKGFRKSRANKEKFDPKSVFFHANLP